MADPAYRRLDVDERRRQLLERGAELFTRHRYDELSMSRIAAEVGISKSLLYHYFPSKQAFFEATLAPGPRSCTSAPSRTWSCHRSSSCRPASAASSPSSRRTRSPTAP